MKANECYDPLCPMHTPSRIDILSEQVGALKVENRDLRAVLTEVQWALAQALRQWSYYSNRLREEPDDEDLGNGATHEDDFYNRAMGALKKLQLANE